MQRWLVNPNDEIEPQPLPSRADSGLLFAALALPWDASYHARLELCRGVHAATSLPSAGRSPII
jgi:hypothetical protein